MSSADFVHLHNHTMYSLLDGAIKIKDFLKTASSMDMRSLAITDHGNLFGAIDFYMQSKKQGIRPIIGTEAYIVDGDLSDKSVGRERSYHLVLLAKNFKGYQNLVKLSSIGYLEGFYYKPRIDKNVLAQHSEGIIALSACLNGEIAAAATETNDDKVDRLIREYLEIFDTEDFYLELQNHDIPEEATVRAALKKASERFGLGLVATNDCHYLLQGHHSAHDALLCLQTGKVLSDVDRMRYSTNQFYMKSADQMKELFADTPQAIENTLKIAEKCSLDIDMSKNLVPEFPLPEGFDSTDDYIEFLANEGLKRLYTDINDKLKERLDYELGVIKQMGYSGYFLIVKDFIDFARKHNIRVGPGRGSAAGSLVSYCLGITSVEPMRYNLLFERFLNPERISMPDIDIDFSDRGRDKVIEYVTQKYGRDNVAQIITFGSMAARAVVRDVGRVHSVPYNDIDKVAKMIPEEIGMTLERALGMSSDLKEIIREDEKIATVLEHAQVLEGLSRHASTHAAGVVIAPGPLINYVPLYKSSKDEITTQFDMRIIEKIGLLKMDFLGLRTLTVIDDALSLIKNNHGTDIDIEKLPLDDDKVYELFTKGQTIGIFQFESSGMREYLKKLGPTCIDDLIAMNALYRPGPLDSGMIDTYIDCKKGRKQIEFPDPLLEPILKDTYGVIVFQEQVLQIAQVMAGYSLGGADILRKAIGKKQAEVMAQQKTEFIEGAVKNKYKRPTAEKVFEMIETFARYGFVKAHSTCYAIIAYQTAYLKAHYPAEFMAAALTNEMNNSARVYAFKNECEELGIDVLPPDINKGFTHFSVDNSQIVFGLAAVKNVGMNAVDTIVEAREKDGAFTDIYDFCRRVDHRTVNKKALESLICAGAFDSLHNSRAQLFNNVEMLVSYGSSVQKEAASGQESLFGQSETITLEPPPLKEYEPWNSTEVRNREKDMLGYYLSSHPLTDEYSAYYALVDMPLEEISYKDDGKYLALGGMISDKPKISMSRRNKLYGRACINDITGDAELLIWEDCVEKCKSILVEGNNILVIGKIEYKEDEKPLVIASELMLLRDAFGAYPCKVMVDIDQDKIKSEALSGLDKVLAEHPGDSEVLLYLNIDGQTMTMRSRQYKVKPSAELLEKLASRFGENKVRFKSIAKFDNGRNKGAYRNYQ